MIRHFVLRMAKPRMQLLSLLLPLRLLGVIGGECKDRKSFVGECGDGQEILMYYGHDGANPGTETERASRCSEACISKKSPLEGSWADFVSKGFIVKPDTGR